MTTFPIAAAGFAEMDAGEWGDAIGLVGLFGTACLIGYIAYLMLDCLVKFLIGERQYFLRRILYITTLIALALALCLRFQITLL